TCYRRYIPGLQRSEWPLAKADNPAIAHSSSSLIIGLAETIIDKIIAGEDRRIHHCDFCFALSSRNLMRSCPTRRHVVCHSSLLICVAGSQSAMHCASHWARRGFISSEEESFREVQGGSVGTGGTGDGLFGGTTKPCAAPYAVLALSTRLTERSQDAFHSALVMCVSRSQNSKQACKPSRPPPGKLTPELPPV